MTIDPEHDPHEPNEDGTEREDDPELEAWRRIYPDAHRNKEGNIVTGDKWGFLFEEPPVDAPPKPDAPRRLPAAKEIYANPTIRRPKRKKGDKGRVSNLQRLEDARWNFEVPGAQLTLHPIRPGKEGWDIMNLVRGRNITYSWGCGCELYIDTEGCEHYKFCKSDDDCERPFND